MSDNQQTDNPLTLKLGNEQLVIRRRYEVLSILNDFFIAIWFLVGSVLFLYPSLERAAIWLFVIGSFQFLIRPTLRLLAHLHVRRLPESHWER
jgi:YrhK-like protein